jgi:hypothetical protein
MIYKRFFGTLALALAVSSSTVSANASDLYMSKPIPDPARAVNPCVEFDNDFAKFPSLFDQIPKNDPGIADSYAIFKKTFVQGLQMQLDTLTPEAKKCHDARRLDILSAFVLSGTAYVRFMSDDHAWEIPLNQANQLLAKCQSDFFGKPNGAVCQKIEESNIANKIQWKMGT